MKGARDLYPCDPARPVHPYFSELALDVGTDPMPWCHGGASAHNVLSADERRPERLAILETEVLPTAQPMRNSTVLSTARCLGCCPGCTTLSSVRGGERYLMEP